MREIVQGPRRRQDDDVVQGDPDRFVLFVLFPNQGQKAQGLGYVHLRGEAELRGVVKACVHVVGDCLPHPRHGIVPPAFFLHRRRFLGLQRAVHILLGYLPAFSGPGNRGYVKAGLPGDLLGQRVILGFRWLLRDIA